MSRLAWRRRMLSTRAAGRLAPPLVWLARGRSGRAGSAAVSACEDWTARLDRFDDAALDLDVMQDIERLGLGRRKGGYNPKQSSLRRRYTCSASLVGAMLTAQDQVPVRSSRSIAQQTRPRQLARWTKECTSLSQCVGAAVGDGAS